MISSEIEYESAKNELQHVQAWLDRLQREHPHPEKGLTKAGLRKMIARLHEELAVYEGTQETREAQPN